MRFMYKSVRAEHCTIYNLEHGEIKVIVAESLHGNTAHIQTGRYVSEGCWRRDPTIMRATLKGDRETLLFRVDPSTLQDKDLRDRIYTNIRERIFIFGRRREESLVGAAHERCIGFSILRTVRLGTFEGACFDILREMAEDLVSIGAKHVEVTKLRCGQTSLANHFNSVESIDLKLAEANARLSQRERQVCARILKGFTGTEIANDLGIAVESAKTYTKRAYRRLEIRGKQELLQYYLSRV